MADDDCRASVVRNFRSAAAYCAGLSLARMTAPITRCLTLKAAYINDCTTGLIIPASLRVVRSFIISDWPLKPIFSIRLACSIVFSLSNSSSPDDAGTCNCLLLSSHKTTIPLDDLTRCMASSSVMAAIAVGSIACASLSEKLNTMFTSW